MSSRLETLGVRFPEICTQGPGRVLGLDFRPRELELVIIKAFAFSLSFTSLA